MRAILALFAVAALAGCSIDAPAAVDKAGDLALAQATPLLIAAIDALPSPFGVDLVVSAALGQQNLTLQASFDDAVSYLGIGGDARQISSLLGRQAAGASLGDRILLRATPDAMTFLTNGTAFTSRAADGPRVDTGAFGALLGAGALLRALADENATITGATPTLWEDEPALAIGLTRASDAGPTTGTVTVLIEPPRLVHIDLALPGGRADPLAGARLTGRILHDAIEIPRPGEDVLRAGALAFDVARGAGNVTWTFRAASGIPLGELAVEVGEPGATWTLRFDETARTHENVTVRFIDADGDGFVSPLDTLHATSEDGSLPRLVLHDLHTDVRVVPGLGLALAMLGVAIVAATRRR